MNYDFQALALESRGMGEVRDFCSPLLWVTNPSRITSFYLLVYSNLTFYFII